jgi:uncharacterized protein YbbC (DUF1343 family)
LNQGEFGEAAMILNGIDCIDKYAHLFKGKRVGLITAPTGLNKDFVSTIQIFHEKFNLVALFSPEHGVRGDLAAGALVDTYLDPQTGVPVYSLYRKDSKRLTQEMLDEVDIIVYDIQDVGTRYYTFLYTMLYALEDCASAGKEFVVLDRINPLDGCNGRRQCAQRRLRILCRQLSAQCTLRTDTRRRSL